MTIVMLVIGWVYRIFFSCSTQNSMLLGKKYTANGQGEWENICDAQYYRICWGLDTIFGAYAHAFIECTNFSIVKIKKGA